MRDVEGNAPFAHQPSGEKFRVRAGGFTVVVVGTRFLVKVDGVEVAVSVDEGVVEIWGGGRSERGGQRDGNDRIARLVPGQSWSAGTVSGPSSLAQAPVKGTASMGASRPMEGTVSMRGDRLRDDVKGQSGQGSGMSVSGVGSRVSEAGVARAAGAGADPTRALAIYQRLAEGGGPRAENALYEIGGIYRDQLRKPRQALAAWERYRSRYPRGMLRAEADLSIVDTLSDLQEGGRALTEALAFLKHYPRSERRGEVARVAGDLYRSRGRCREAADLYGRVDATSAADTDADDAAFGRAACLATLGDPAAASALRSYARNRPAGRHRSEVVRLLGGAIKTGQP